MLKAEKSTGLPWLKRYPFYLFSKLRHFGLSRYCPVCESHVRAFHIYGLKHRRDAQCPVCHALERHRFLWPFLKRHTKLLDRQPKKILCFALEPMFEKKLQAIYGLEYIFADLYNPHAMVKMDITQIEFPAAAFDLVYCSHVLEHVDDDVKAIREIHRVLKHDGQAVIMVPLTAPKTFEDSSITDPAERERVFGQFDHVRVYGPDVKDRLEAAGFTVEVFHSNNFFTEKECKRYGLAYISPEKMPIYLCQKHRK